MKSKLNDQDQRYLLLFKLDARSLYHRIHDRMHEYVEVFALKRNRDHFDEVFRNRYERATVRDIAHCPMEIIDALDQYYNYVDEIYWYVKHTEDMPNTVEDELTRMSARLRRLYDQLSLFVDAELSGYETENPDHLIQTDDDAADDLVSELSVQDDDRFSPDVDRDY
jgi:hypothetical protein